MLSNKKFDQKKKKSITKINDISYKKNVTNPTSKDERLVVYD